MRRTIMAAILASLILATVPSTAFAAIQTSLRGPCNFTDNVNGKSHSMTWRTKLIWNGNTGITSNLSTKLTGGPGSSSRYRVEVWQWRGGLPTLLLSYPTVNSGLYDPVPNSSGWPIGYHRQGGLVYAYSWEVHLLARGNVKCKTFYNAQDMGGSIY